MLFFLYTSGLLTILLGMKLFHMQEKKLLNKNYNENQLFNYWIKRMIANLVVMCTTACIVLFVIPFLIWIIGPKETGVVDKILETKELAPLSSSDKNQYIKENSDKSGTTYLINLGDEKKSEIQSFGSKSVELVNTKKGQRPKYEKVAQYKMKKLKGNWLIANAVNDIYANVYIQYDEGEYIGNKVRIYAPSK